MENIKEKAEIVLYEMNRLDSTDLDAESLTLNEIWEMIKKLLTDILKDV